MPTHVRLRAFLGPLVALLALCAGSRGLAAPAPHPTPTRETVSPTVVEVALRAVAPGPASSPRGELQPRIYGARTFYSAFVFHISGEASGFPKALAVNYACSVFDLSHASIGSGTAHAQFNDVGTSYPVTDDIVAVEADAFDATAGATWTCSMAVVDKAGKPMAVDAARSILEASGTIAPHAH